MATYTQSAPQAYPVPMVAMLSGGYGGVGTQAEQFANINVINQITTSNDTLDDGTGIMTVAATGNRTVDIASFVEPNIGNGNIASVAVGKSVGVTGLAAELSYNCTGTNTGFASVQVKGNAPILTIDQTNTVRVGASALYNSGAGNGTMTLFPSGTATQIDLGVYQTTLGVGNSASIQLGYGGSTNTSLLLSYTKGAGGTDSSGALGMTGGSSPGFAVDGFGSYLPLATGISSKGTDLGANPVTIDPTSGLIKSGISGTVTLSGGSAVVSNAGIFGTSLVFVTSYDPSIGPLTVTVGLGSFTVTDQSGSTDGIVAYMVI